MATPYSHQFCTPNIIQREATTQQASNCHHHINLVLIHKVGLAKCKCLSNVYPKAITDQNLCYLEVSSYECSPYNNPI